MVLFKILKDIIPTSMKYNITKDTNFSGSVTVSIGGNLYNYNITNVKTSIIDQSDTYGVVQIEGVFIVPQPFTLQRIDFGGNLTRVTLGDMSIQLPLGGYYVRATVTIQSPQTFDFFVS